MRPIEATTVTPSTLPIDAADVTPHVQPICSSAYMSTTRPIDVDAAALLPMRTIDAAVAITKVEQFMERKKIFIQILRCVC